MNVIDDKRIGNGLVTAMLVLMLASGLMAGMFAALIADQRSHATDRDQSVAYAAAHAGLEKLTASLAALFATDFSPNAGADRGCRQHAAGHPGLPRTRAPGGAAGSGYDITFTPDSGSGPQRRQSAGRSRTPTSRPGRSKDSRA